MEVSAPGPGARHTDRWGGVELKVSSWTPDGITTKWGTRTTEEVPPDISLLSLATSHSASSPLMNGRWGASGHFGCSGNLSQVSSLFGAAGTWAEADFYVSLWFHPLQSLSKTFPSRLCKVELTSKQIKAQHVDILRIKGSLFTQKPAKPVYVPERNVKNILILAWVHFHSLFPLTEEDNPLLHIHLFPEVCTLMTESGGIDRYIMSRTELHTLL